jgi:hypothetical protein
VWCFLSYKIICNLTNGVVLNTYMEIYLEFFPKSLPCPPLIILHLGSLSNFDSRMHLVLSHIQVILIICNNRQILVVGFHAFNISLIFSMLISIACLDQSMWSLFFLSILNIAIVYTNVVFSQLITTHMPPSKRGQWRNIVNSTLLIYWYYFNLF